MYQTISTPCGDVRGISEGGVTSYRGIRYATARRWEYPTLVTSWEGTYDATAYGDCCYQRRAIYDEAKEKAFYYKEFREGLAFTYSEDCLSLNIFTPEGAKAGDDLPVIVYIHGGSFRSGSANETCFDGPNWPHKGVIGVTVQYRLGLLGFACLRELAEEAGGTGNYGLADQIAALAWLQRNIAAFGGNPGNVTVMGQSAGAMSVQALCFSPKAEGLFHRAVMVSGGGITPMMKLKPAKSAMPLFARLFEETGCKTLEELRAYDPVKLFGAYYALCEKHRDMAMIGVPYIDGTYLVEPQARSFRRARAIPTLIGTTEEDIMSPILYDMARKWCLMQAKKHGCKTYLWMFDRHLPGDESGSFHCADMWYWFGTLHRAWRPFEEKDYRLMEEMTDYLCRFAACGDPNGDGHPTWLPIDRHQRKALFLGEGETRMDRVKLPKLIRIMLRGRPVGF